MPTNPTGKPPLDPTGKPPRTTLDPTGKPPRMSPTGDAPKSTPAVSSAPTTGTASPATTATTTTSPVAGGTGKAEVDSAGFYGVTHVVLAAHAEDNLSGLYDPWTAETFAAFLQEAVPFVEWLASKEMPAHFEPVPDFVAAVMAGPKVEGQNFIAWSMTRGIMWDARAHRGGLYNAADSAWSLEQAGAPFNGILGSYEDAADYAGMLTAKKTPGKSYRWDTLTGLGNPGHTNETFYAGLKTNEAEQVIVLGGRSASFAHTTAISKAVASGKLRAGVVKQMFNLGRRKDGRASFLSSPIGHTDRAVAEQTGGVLARTEIERTLAESSGVTYEDFPTLLARWKASGGQDYVYDAATINATTNKSA